jgi:uncharacterized protein (TIGR02145 family)
MKRKIKSFLLFAIGLFLLHNYSCKKKDPVVLFPIVISSDISSIGQDSAVCGGNVTDDGGDIISERGICWSPLHIPTIADSKTIDGTGNGSFTSVIQNVNPATTYFVRAYATNSKGTSYGNTQFFVTKQGNVGAVTDIDGNVYHTVNIGTQVWMVENLNVTKFRNGDNIPNVTDSLAWNNCGTNPAYCNYDNNPANSIIYGKLYNWYTLNDSRNPAPNGWHVSTHDDWAKLKGYLRIYTVIYETVGSMLKKNDYSLWENLVDFEVPSCGFEALPGGNRDIYGFRKMRNYGYWWTITPGNSGDSENTALLGSEQCELVINSYYKSCGFSIRCVKD